MKKTTVLRVVPLLTFLLHSLVANAQTITWLTDVNQARQLAQKTKQPILVDFSGSDWCTWCKRLDDEVFSRPEYAEWAAPRFIHVVLDATRDMVQTGAIPHRYLMDQYGVEGFPTVIVMDADGKQLARGGYIAGGARAFIDFLKPYAADFLAEASNQVTSPEGLDRGAAAILQRLNMLVEGKQDKIEDAIEVSVLLSQWESVERYLTQMKPEESDKLYRRIVELVGKKQKEDKTATISLEDVLALVDICPGEPTDDMTTLLAELLKTVLTDDAEQAELIATLDKGTKRLGGDSPQGRRRAADLLMKAGLTEIATRYIAPVDVAVVGNDAIAISYHLNDMMKRGINEQDEEALRQAWELAQVFLHQTPDESGYNPAALQAMSRMLPHLGVDQRDQWLDQCFTNDPQLAVQILQWVGNAILSNTQNPDITTRTRMLTLLREVDTELAAWENKKPDAALASRTALAWAWLAEAQWSIEQVRLQREQDRRALTGQLRQNEKPPSPFVPVEQILACEPPNIPHTAWAPTLPLDVEATHIRLQIQRAETDKVVQDIARIHDQDPALAATLARELLDDWVKFNVLYRPQAQANVRHQRQPMAVPLTAARHAMVMSDLANIVATLRSIPGLAVPPEAWVQAFMQCNPPMEIFTRQDIEAVFGPVAELPFDMAATFAAVMRPGLTSIWRDPDARRAMGKSANKEVIRSEINKGYTLLHGILNAHISDAPDHWKLHTYLGTVMFDWAEYDHEMGVALQTYTERRDAALEHVRKGAELYARHATSLSPSDYSVAAFEQWFQTILGASDLTHISGRGVLPEQHLRAIRDAMDAMGELADKHITLFAAQFAAAIPRLPPESKQRYLRAALVVVGDQPRCTEARDLVNFYDTLVGEYGEIQLLTELDGSPEVGHDVPFGLYLKLRHTETVANSIGGFGRYLVNASAGYGMPYRTRTDYLDVLEKNITDAFGDGLELQSITFADPVSEPLATDRPDWYDFTLAYIVLRATDPAIDRIPPIQMDLDFQDSQGPVVLAVSSPILPIDARAPRPPQRPVSDILLTQTLDARDIGEGSLLLEVSAAAQGLLPDIDSMLDLDIPGCDILDVEDQGLVIRELTCTNGAWTPVCERDWTVRLKPTDTASTFVFPAATIDISETQYQRYDDADIVPATRELSMSVLRGHRAYPWIPGAILVIAAAGAAYWWFRRRATVGNSALPLSSYTVPAQLTPFAALGVLQRMRTDPQLTKQVEALTTDITRVENAFFSPEPTAAMRPEELRDLVTHWVEESK